MTKVMVFGLMTSSVKNNYEFSNLVILFTFYCDFLNKMVLQFLIMNEINKCIQMLRYHVKWHTFYLSQVVNQVYHVYDHF